MASMDVFGRIWPRLICLALIISTLLVGCGGGGAPTFPFAGTYRGDFTSTNPTSVVVSIGSGGVTSAVVSDSTGVLASGDGTTTTDGVVSISMNGSVGATTLAGSFGRAASGLTLDLSGGINKTGVNAPPTGNVSVYKGKYKFQFAGSSTGDLLVTISTDGTVYKRVGTSLTQIGKVTATGTISFGGTDLVSPSTVNTNWTGQIFVTPSSSGGSGTYVGKTDPSFSGTWNAIPDEPVTPIFNTVTAVKSLSVSEYPSVQAVSPNGHMVGFSGSKAVYWDSPTSDPVELSNPGNTTITWMVGVNSSGAKVGYSYMPNQLNTALPVYYAPGSSSPSVLSLPDHYVGASLSGINDNGTIVGVIVHETDFLLKPCVWPAGGGQPFIPPKGDMGGIANNGVIVCLANKGYLESPSAQDVIPIPPANGYSPLTLSGMSPAGVIFGHGPLNDDGLKHPIAWPVLTQAGVPLKFINGFTEMTIAAAGPNGEFLGRGLASGASNSQAIYWANSASVALLDDIVQNNVITYKGGLAVFADGAILAYGTYPNGSFTISYLQK